MGGPEFSNRVLLPARPLPNWGVLTRYKPFGGRGPSSGSYSVLPLCRLQCLVCRPYSTPGKRMGQTRSGRSARLSPKVLAISAHTIFKREQTAGAPLNDAFLRQIVD